MFSENARLVSWRAFLPAAFDLDVIVAAGFAVDLVFKVELAVVLADELEFRKSRRPNLALARFSRRLDRGSRPSHAALRKRSSSPHPNPHPARPDRTPAHSPLACRLTHVEFESLHPLRCLRKRRSRHSPVSRNPPSEFADLPRSSPAPHRRKCRRFGYRQRPTRDQEHRLDAPHPT